MPDPLGGAPNLVCQAPTRPAEVGVPWVQGKAICIDPEDSPNRIHAPLGGLLGRGPGLFQVRAPGDKVMPGGTIRGLLQDITLREGTQGSCALGPPAEGNARSGATNPPHGGHNTGK